MSNISMCCVWSSDILHELEQKYLVQLSVTYIFSINFHAAIVEIQRKLTSPLVQCSHFNTDNTHGCSYILYDL